MNELQKWTTNVRTRRLFLWIFCWSEFRRETPAGFLFSPLNFQGKITEGTLTGMNESPSTGEEKPRTENRLEVAPVQAWPERRPPRAAAKPSEGKQWRSLGSKNGSVKCDWLPGSAGRRPGCPPLRPPTWRIRICYFLKYFFPRSPEKHRIAQGWGSPGEGWGNSAGETPRGSNRGSE